MNPASSSPTSVTMRDVASDSRSPPTSHNIFAFTQVRQDSLLCSYILFYKHFFFFSNVGEKPFQCDLCGRNFRQSGNLTKHLKSHENAHLRWNRSTSEKPYKCPHEGCDKSFTAKSSLQNHIRCHAGDFSGTVNLTNPNSFVDPSNKSMPSMMPMKVQKDKVMKYHCIHPNCKKVFKDESELRAHLIAYSPGMAAENQFLRDSMVTLLDFLEQASKQIPDLQYSVRTSPNSDFNQLFSNIIFFNFIL